MVRGRSIWFGWCMYIYIVASPLGLGLGWVMGVGLGGERRRLSMTRACMQLE